MERINQEEIGEALVKAFKEIEKEKPQEVMEFLGDLNQLLLTGNLNYNEVFSLMIAYLTIEEIEKLFN